MPFFGHPDLLGRWLLRCCLVPDSTRQSALSAVSSRSDLRSATNTQQLRRQNFCSRWTSLVELSSGPDTYRLQMTAEWRDTFFGKHDYSALRLLMCCALEKHLLTYLLIYELGIDILKMYGVPRKNFLGHNFQKNKKLIRRWDSDRELSLRRHCTRTKNTIDSCINSATERFLQRRFTKFSEITQCDGHYAVQGHSRSPILVPIESSYTTSY